MTDLPISVTGSEQPSSRATAEPATLSPDGLAFDDALNVLGQGWEFSHLIRLDHGSWQVNLEHIEDQFVVVATGDTPADAVLAAWERTFDDCNYMRLAAATALVEPSLDGKSLAQRLGLVKPKVEIDRRI